MFFSVPFCFFEAGDEETKFILNEGGVRVADGLRRNRSANGPDRLIAKLSMFGVGCSVTGAAS
jgi:hypothetical protein